MKKGIVSLFTCLFVLLVIFSSCQKGDIVEIDQQERGVEANGKERSKTKLDLPTEVYETSVNCALMICDDHETLGNLTVEYDDINFAPTFVRVLLQADCVQDISEFIVVNSDTVADWDFYLFDQYGDQVDYQTGTNNSVTFPIDDFSCGNYTVRISYFDQDDGIDVCIYEGTIALLYRDPMLVKSVH